MYVGYGGETSKRYRESRERASEKQRESVRLEWKKFQGQFARGKLPWASRGVPRVFGYFNVNFLVYFFEKK